MMLPKTQVIMKAKSKERLILLVSCTRARHLESAESTYKLALTEHQK
jgi:hypothetical protein